MPGKQLGLQAAECKAGDNTRIVFKLYLDGLNGLTDVYTNVETSLPADPPDDNVRTRHNPPAATGVQSFEHDFQTPVNVPYYAVAWAEWDDDTVLCVYDGIPRPPCPP